MKIVQKGCLGDKIKDKMDLNHCILKERSENVDNRF
jgi:hypothetical protein